MRDYSKPYFDIVELTAAYNGICKRIGKEDFCCASAMPLLGQRISMLAQSVGISLDPTGDVGTAGINLQHLIEGIIKNGIASKEELRSYIDAELVNIPKNPLIDYFDY